MAAEFAQVASVPYDVVNTQEAAELAKGNSTLVLLQKTGDQKDRNPFEYLRN